MRKENELVEQKELREQMIDRIEVLDKVGELLLLPNTEYATTEQVAKYFKVGKEAIKSVCYNNNEELISNGLKYFTAKENKAFLVSCGLQPTNFRGYYMVGNNKFSNGKTRLFPKRAILNVGMLLRDSEVAKELRSKLLDILHDSESGEGSLDTIIDEINEEKILQIQLGESIYEGNMSKVIEVMTKINELKNKRIEEMKPKADYYDNVLDSDKLLTVTDIAKDLGISARKLNKILHESKIQYKQGETWFLYSEHQDRVPEYCDYHITEYGQRLKFTEKGREWIISILKNDLAS